MTFVSNFSHPGNPAKCVDGIVTVNSSITNWDRLQNNFMSTATSPHEPWSTPVPLDSVFDAAVDPFVNNGVPNRNSNIIITIAQDGRDQWKDFGDGVVHPPRRRESYFFQVQIPRKFHLADFQVAVRK